MTQEQIHYDTKRDTKYALRLPEVAVEEYFCHPATKWHPKTAVVYTRSDEDAMKRDMKLCGGTPVEITGEVFSTLYHSGRYSNTLPSPWELKGEYEDTLRGMARNRDDRQELLDL